jgi:hypothetical protein
MFLSGGAAASAAEWSARAGACVLDEKSVGRVAVSENAELAPKTAATIEARCNVTNPNDNGAAPSWNTLIVFYHDLDGKSLQSRVAATLFSVDKLTGGSIIIATFDSNDPAHVENGLTGIQRFSHTFNFGQNGYFVLLTVTGADASQLPRMFSVQLRN